MSFLSNSRIKKNIFVKTLYYLLNLDAFFVVFHNNKNFTSARNKVLFSNSIKAFVVKNNIVLKLLGKQNLFANLFVGPSGFILLQKDINLIKFFEYYFALYSAEQMELILLAVFWNSRKRFLSLEYINLLVKDVKKYDSLSNFMLITYVTIFSNLIRVFFNFILLLNTCLLNLLFSFFHIMVIKKECKN